MIIIPFLYFLFHVIPATHGYVSSQYENTNLSESVINTIAASGKYYYWQQIPLYGKAIMLIALPFEIYIELTIFLIMLPRATARGLKKMFNRNNNMAIMNTIDFKIKNGYRLTKKEQRYIDRNKVATTPKGNSNVS